MSTRGKPWHQHLTIDLLATVLARTLFHPFIAGVFPLSLRALGAAYTSREFIISCIYAGCISLIWILSVVNRRVAYGLPRVLDWDDEVVVITGGAGGLGGIIAQMFGMRGASVAILDVRPPTEEYPHVKFYQCNVGNAEDVERVREEIEMELGIVTILINNAGVVNAQPLWTLTPTQVQRNFNVNLLAHFYTIRTFLPGMLAAENGGTIVTVSSVLGKLGASYLADYTAAKAGLNAMHASLRAELASGAAPEGATNIRTILVTPGQLSTALFAGVETPSNFLGPVVEPVELAREIVSMIDAGESGEISLPLYAQWIEWLHVLPAALQKVARSMSGVDNAMEKSHRQSRKQE